DDGFGNAPPDDLGAKDGRLVAVAFRQARQSPQLRRFVGGAELPAQSVTLQPSRPSMAHPKVDLLHGVADENDRQEEVAVQPIAGTRRSSRGVQRDDARSRPVVGLFW